MTATALSLPDAQFDPDRATQRITVADGALIVMVGAAGAGKSTLARTLFAPDAIVSTDEWRWRLSGDEADQTVSGAAHALTRAHARARLAAGHVTVIDSTASSAAARRSWVRIARHAGVPVYAIVAATPLPVALARNAARSRVVPADVVAHQHAAVTRARFGTAWAGVWHVAPGDTVTVTVAPRATRRP